MKRFPAALVGLWFTLSSLLGAAGGEAAVAPPSRSVSYKGGKAVVSVPMTGPGATLAVTPRVTVGSDWLTIEPASVALTVKLSSKGAGKVKVAFGAAANGSVDARTGMIQVAGVTLAVYQPGAPCRVTLGAARGAANGPETFGAFVVRAPEGCEWDAAASVDVPWLQVVHGAFGEGGGAVVYRAFDNRGGKNRSGAVTVVPRAEKPKKEIFTLKQGGSAEPSATGWKETAFSLVEDQPMALDLRRLAGGEQTGGRVLVPPAWGALTGAFPSLTYTPRHEFSGADEFRCASWDRAFVPRLTVVKLTVTPANETPVAAIQAVNTDEDTAKMITLAGRDPEGSTLTFQVATPPAHGSLTGTPPAVTYTPEANWNGTDRFTFTTSDGSLTSASAEVTITVAAVNDAPVAAAQAVTTDEDTAKEITLAGSDPDGSTLTFQMVTPPAHGRLTGTSPAVTYTPEANWNGTDTFSFTVRDGSLASAPAEVTINVTPAWYRDADGDGYSDGARALQTTRPARYFLASELLRTSGDCNDGAALVHPGAFEVCSDGVDNDCAGGDAVCTRTLLVEPLGAGAVTSATDPTLHCTGACSANHPHGTTLVLTATAAAGSGFAYWTGCDTVSGADCTVTLTSDRTVLPTYRKPVVLKAGVVQLNEVHMAALTALTDSTLTFDPAVLGTPPFAEGDVVVSPVVTPVAEGLLRRVAALRTEGLNLIVDTTPATLEDVIQEGVLATRTALSASAPAGPVLYEAPGLRVRKAVGGSAYHFDIDRVIYDVDGLPETVEDQFRLVGSFDADLTLDTALEVGLSGIRGFKVVVVGNKRLTLETRVSSGLSIPTPLNKTLNPLPISLPPVALGPVVLVPQMDLVAKIGGSVDAAAATGITLGVELTGGGLWRRGEGWRMISSAKPTFAYTTLPTVRVSAALKASVGPELTLKICGVAGPSVFFDGYLKLAASVDTSGSYGLKLYGGLEGGVGLKAELLNWVLAEARFTLFDVRTTLYSLAEGSLERDVQSPTVPGTPQSTSSTPTSLSLEWSPSWDDREVAGYRLFGDLPNPGVELIPPNYRVSGLEPGTQYCYEVEAFDAAGNASARSAAACFTTPALTDTTPPGAPTGVMAVADDAGTGFAVTWTAPSDPDVAGYLIARDGTRLGATSAIPRFTETLAPGGRHCYQVWVFDKAGNLSTASPRACAGWHMSDVYTDPITGMEFVWVPAGTFQMGSAGGYTSNQPVHEVTLTQGFYIGKHEVTQAQWQAIMGSNPSYNQPSTGRPACPTCPVESVSWIDAQSFLQTLSARTGRAYRLPTEAEWEYAARGGPFSEGYTFAGSNDANEVAWYWGNSGAKTHPVGSKLPNELGLYDMSGNVWEWVQDFYEPYYPAGLVIDTPGPLTGYNRVIRGDNWYGVPCALWVRTFHGPGIRYYDQGFRAVTVR